MHRAVGAYQWRMVFCDAPHVGAYRWMAVVSMAIRRWRQPPKDGCIIIALGWLAYLGSVAEELIYRRRAVV